MSTHLKSLKFVPVTRGGGDPVTKRREKLVERIAEQIALSKDFELRAGRAQAPPGRGRERPARRGPQADRAVVPQIPGRGHHASGEVRLSRARAREGQGGHRGPVAREAGRRAQHADLRDARGGAGRGPRASGAAGGRSEEGRQEARGLARPPVTLDTGRLTSDRFFCGALSHRPRIRASIRWRCPSRGARRTPSAPSVAPGASPSAGCACPSGAPHSHRRSRARARCAPRAARTSSWYRAAGTDRRDRARREAGTPCRAPGRGDFARRPSRTK